MTDRTADALFMAWLICLVVFLGGITGWMIGLDRFTEAAVYGGAALLFGVITCWLIWRKK